MTTDQTHIMSRGPQIERKKETVSKEKSFFTRYSIWQVVKLVASFRLLKLFNITGILTSQCYTVSSIKKAAICWSHMLARKEFFLIFHLHC